MSTRIIRLVKIIDLKYNIYKYIYIFFFKLKEKNLTL